AAIVQAALASAPPGMPAPLASVRSGLSALAGRRSLRPWLERPLDELRDEVLGLAAAAASVVVAASAALAGGQAPAPSSDSHAERYLHGLTGRPPAPSAVRALDRSAPRRRPPHHGIRSPHLSDRRPARDVAAPHGDRERPGPGRAGLGRRGSRPGGPRGGEAGAAAANQRGVLGSHHARRLWHSPRLLHRHVHRE